jgi:hypothetical protein
MGPDQEGIFSTSQLAAILNSNSSADLQENKETEKIKQTHQNWCMFVLDIKLSARVDVGVSQLEKNCSCKEILEVSGC